MSEYLTTVDELWAHYKNDCLESQCIDKWDWEPKYLVLNTNGGMDQYKKLNQWCSFNCDEKWYGWSWCYWMFENEDDAILFKLSLE